MPQQPTDDDKRTKSLGYQSPSDNVMEVDKRDRDWWDVDLRWTTNIAKLKEWKRGFWKGLIKGLVAEILIPLTILIVGLLILRACY